MLDWMDPARIFEPEAEERAGGGRRTAQALPAAQGAAALPGATPVSAPRRILLSLEAIKNPYLTKNLCTCRNECIVIARGARYAWAR